jgi:hypothetical protein
MHSFTTIQTCENGKQVSLSLSDGKTIIDINGLPPSSMSLVGRATGNKKTNSKRNVGASSTLVDASIGKIIADVSSNSRDRKQNNDARWKLLLEKAKKEEWACSGKS